MGFAEKYLCDKCERHGKYNSGTGRSFCDTCYCGSHFDDEMTAAESSDMFEKLSGKTSVWVSSNNWNVIPADDNSKMSLEELKEAWNAQKPVDISKIVKNLSYNTISDADITPKNRHDGYAAMVYSIDELSTLSIPEFKLTKMSMLIMLPSFIKNVIFNDPATIVFWADGTKTVVKAVDEPFDKEKGLAMAICKKIFGNKGNYFNVIKEWTEKE